MAWIGYPEDFGPGIFDLFKPGLKVMQATGCQGNHTSKAITAQNFNRVLRKFLNPNFTPGSHLLLHQLLGDLAVGNQHVDVAPLDRAQDGWVFPDAARDPHRTFYVMQLF